MASNGYLTDQEYFKLQHEHGGRYVLGRGAEVIASSATYGELVDQIKCLDVNWAEAIIEHVRRPDIVYLYSPWKIITSEIP
jgi:hypothetical protein